MLASDLLRDRTAHLKNADIATRVPWSEFWLYGLRLICQLLDLEEPAPDVGGREFGGWLLVEAAANLSIRPRYQSIVLGATVCCSAN